MFRLNEVIHIRGTDMVCIWEKDCINNTFNWLLDDLLERRLTGRLLEYQHVEHLI